MHSVCMGSGGGNADVRTCFSIESVYVCLVTVCVHTCVRTHVRAFSIESVHVCLVTMCAHVCVCACAHLFQY